MLALVTVGSLAGAWRLAPWWSAVAGGLLVALWRPRRRLALAGAAVALHVLCAARLDDETVRHAPRPVAREIARVRLAVGERRELWAGPPVRAIVEDMRMVAPTGAPPPSSSRGEVVLVDLELWGDGRRLARTRARFVDPARMERPRAHQVAAWVWDRDRLTLPAARRWQARVVGLDGARGELVVTWAPVPWDARPTPPRPGRGLVAVYTLGAIGVYGLVELLRLLVERS